MSRRWVVPGGLLLIAALVLVMRALGGGDGVEVDLGVVEVQDVFRSYVTASGELVAERYADIGSSIMGRVVELPVVEGQSIEQGALLARIDPVQARSELDAAEEAIRALEAEAVAADEQVGSTRADLQVAEARAREATLNYDRINALSERQLVSQSERDSAIAAADSARAQVTAARAAVSRVEGSRNAAQRRVAQARAQAARFRDRLSKTAIVAPISGTVSRLQVREGEMVVIGIQNQPGTVLMTISDLAELNAEVKVAEADILRVREGQRAEVSLGALPGEIFKGRVTEVGASALPQIGTGVAAREFRVEVRLESPDAGMRPGLTCDAEILVGEETDVTTVPLQAVVLRNRDDDDAETRGVFTVESGVVRFVPVQTGIIGGLDILVAGVPAGTEVVVGPYQALRDLDDGDAVRVR